MKRGEIEHVIRAAADVVDDEIVVVGSQAVLGETSDPPAQLLVSMEADVFPLSTPERSIEIDGALGDGSPFHAMNGYFAHGVGPETPRAPKGWQGRLVPIVFEPTGGWRRKAVGHFMEIHDLVVSKLVAGREKNLDYAVATIQAGLVDVDNLRRGIDLLDDLDRTSAERSLDVVSGRLGA